MKTQKTKHYSWKAGRLARGCRQCVKGEKLVLFVTGICSKKCSFCPVSDKKLYQDVTYANERPVTNISQIIEEAKACNARGAGITGGDPLARLSRTTSYIKALKQEFGKSFHIHLYTPLKLVNKNNLKQLYESGLDEIRFHPELNNKAEWKKISLAKSLDWDVGVEIPAMPGKEKQTKQLIDFIAGKTDFLNINELELADNAVWRKKKSIKTKDRLSYAIKGSHEAAKKLLEHAAKKNINTHYCTCRLKDRVQLANRIKRRAKNTKLKTDRLTKQGMLIRGAIYTNELIPGRGYHEKLESLKPAEKKKILNKLNTIRKNIIQNQGVRPGLLSIDRHKPRLLTSQAIVKKIKTGRGMKKAIVTEYPTFDALELKVEFL